ncbi:MAG: dihydrodipicolinate synthase family protein [Anaerolineales bacterium]|jgi:4-hydroxy-2-oxoglutarate aldolase
MNATIQFHGLYPPIPTPFDSNGEIDFTKLEENLNRWETEPLAGYVVGGSNGEFVSLTNPERVAVVRFVRERTDPGRLVIAGAGLPSTRATIDLGLQMADAGATCLLVVTPSYYKSKMDPATLVRYYHEVADQLSLPLILYNVPANTGIDMSAETVLAAAEHSNIIAIKDSSGRIDKLGAIVRRAPDGFFVLAGSGGYMLGALTVGAVGAVAALANIAASALYDVLNEFESGNFVSAQRNQLRLIDLNTAVTARYGVPGLKAAMDMLGYYGGPVRGPLVDLDEASRQNLRAILVHADLI